MTGLGNRTLALERIGHALVRRERYGGDLAVLFVDLDRFNLVNDNLGHDAGDELLCVVADRLTTSVRATDSVARVAGDEFVVICDELDRPDEAQVIAHRILSSLQEPVDLAGERVRVRGSIGIAFAHGDTDTAEDLLRDAAAAMYRAKESGRAQVAAFDDSMRQRLRNELHMEREIAECLDRGELRVW
ncbi:MAG: GGDEF domain-containing protein [Nakamurella sp.]